MQQSMEAQLRRVSRQVQMMTAPVMITATDDSGPIHKVQVHVNGTPEVIDDIGVSQLYGFASHAMTGTDATALFAGGDRSRPIIISTGNQRFRLRGLASGEVALYTDEGDSVKLARGKIVEVVAQEQCIIKTKTALVQASEKVRMETPRLEVTGDIIDHCDEQAHTAANMREIYNTHHHPGVQRGGELTDPPDRLQR